MSEPWLMSVVLESIEDARLLHINEDNPVGLILEDLRELRRLTAKYNRLREWAREANALLCKQFEMGSSLFPYAKVASLIRTYPIDEEE